MASKTKKRWRAVEISIDLVPDDIARGIMNGQISRNSRKLIKKVVRYFSNNTYALRPSKYVIPYAEAMSARHNWNCFEPELQRAIDFRSIHSEIHATVNENQVTAYVNSDPIDPVLSNQHADPLHSIGEVDDSDVSRLTDNGADRATAKRRTRDPIYRSR